MRILPALSLMVVLLLSPRLGAQEPAISTLTPAAVLPGAPTTVVVRGTGLAEARGLWTSFPAQVRLAEGEGNGTKNDLVTYEIVPGSDAPVGIHAVRLWTTRGVSPLKYLLIDDLPTTAQAGNNTTLETAQALSLPTGVDGTVGNLTTQYFKMTVAEGQRLTFEVLARRLGSALDPMIRILDASGRELAFSDDAPGLSGDSQVTYKFAAAGDYFLELRDIRYQGGAYRLRIGDFPAAAAAYPLAVQRGQSTAVTLAGSGVDGVEPVTVAPPADATTSFWPVAAKRAGGTSSGFSFVELSDRPQFLETEPNQNAEQANVLDLTHDVNGRIDQPGDVDYYSFTATKGAYIFTGVARTQGSPADLMLKVLKADGSQLAAVDDTGVDEGTMTVTFPEDGKYLLVVEELTKRGGPDFAYRVAIRPNAPAFTLGVSLDSFNVPLGGSVFATVTSKRSGYNGPIELSVTGLPDGMTASRSVIGPGRNDAVLTLTVNKDVSPGSFHLVKVVGVGADGTPAVTSEFSAALRTRLANMRYPAAHLNEQVAISTAAAPGFAWQAEPAEVVFGKQLSTKVKLSAIRAEGWDDAIAVALQPAQNGVPAGITVGVKNIDKGKGEVELAISADDKAPLGDFTVGLLGTLKKDKATSVQPIALRLSLTAPLTVEALPASEGKLAPGGELEVTVNIARNPALAGPVAVTFTNLPAGVTAMATIIPADQSTATVKLTAAADAAKGTVNNVQVKSVVTVGNVKHEALSPNVTLRIEEN